MAIVEINFRPSEKELRWFGLLLWAFFALIAALAYWRTGALAIPKILGVVGTGLCVVYSLISCSRSSISWWSRRSERSYVSSVTIHWCVATSSKADRPIGSNAANPAICPAISDSSDHARIS